MFLWIIPLVLTLELPAQWATVALALLTLAFVVVNVVRPLGSNRRMAATVRLRPWRKYVGWLTLGAIAQIVVTLASLIMHEQLADWRLLPHLPDDPQPIPPSYFTNPLGPAAMFLAAAVLTPMVEEFGCRGRMQRRLERELGIVPAIVIPAVIFCLLHGLIVAAHHLIFALFVGWVVWRTGSIWTAVYVHMVNNAAAVAVMFLTHGWAEMTEIPARLWPYAIAAGLLAAGLVWIAAWRIHLVAQRHRPRAGPLSPRRPLSSDLAPARG
jgi:membrane protease YdiL (CAAX protease family)